MTAALCAKFPDCPNSTNDATVPKCHRPDCPGCETMQMFLHVMPLPGICDHDFDGWRACTPVTTLIASIRATSTRGPRNKIPTI
jgi:hypothetical protein